LGHCTVLQQTCGGSPLHNMLFKKAPALVSDWHWHLAGLLARDCNKTWTLEMWEEKWQLKFNLDKWLSQWI